MKWHIGGEPAFKKLSHLIIAILVLVFIVSILSENIPTTSANSEPLYISHTVEAGQTLWSIAVHYRSDADPREIIYSVREINNISATIYPGQKILVPVAP